MGINTSVTNISGNYPSLLDIANLVRGIVNDSSAGATGTQGEGQIITDNPLISPFTLQFLNSSARELFRELRNVGDPQLIKDNIIITGLTPINGPNGLGSPDPSKQQILNTTGFYDGLEFNQNLLLPADCIYPERLWERQTTSNLPFVDMHQSQFGLAPRNQVNVLSDWEWRNNALNFNGSLTTRDIRVRYYCTFPTTFSTSLNYATTYIPIQDSQDALAYKTAELYAQMLGSPMLTTISAKAEKMMFQLKNAIARRAQSVEYHREEFQGGSGQGNGSPEGGSFGYGA